MHTGCFTFGKLVKYPGMLNKVRRQHVHTLTLRMKWQRSSDVTSDKLARADWTYITSCSQKYSEITIIIFTHLQGWKSMQYKSRLFEFCSKLLALICFQLLLWWTSSLWTPLRHIGSGGTAPIILNLRPRKGWSVSFTACST
jgi:hypothetical protein